MGTRSLTIVRDEHDKEILTLYRSASGNLLEHGEELLRFLTGFRICSGFGLAKAQGKWANGMGCLAAQLVSHFKHGMGTFYLIKPGQRGWNEEYIYTITAPRGDNGTVNLIIEAIYGEKSHLLYKGNVNNCDLFKVKDINDKLDKELLLSNVR
jgi:hypothetical protein